MADNAKVSANDKIVVGCIGVGGMGSNNLRGFMNQPDVEVAAVCDVDADMLGKAIVDVKNKYGRKPQAFTDFRGLLEMKELDAVMIATPDHWHALPFIMACEAGKDVFSEKPLSHSIVEAQSMFGAAKQHKRVVQINTVQRSGAHFRDAIDFVRSGGCGNIRVCRAWICGKTGVGKNPVKEPPAHLDWNMWLGPGPDHPYHDRIHPYDWRCYLNWGTGNSGNWGAHHIDIVLLGMNEWHPLDVTSVGGRFHCPEDDDQTTPDTMITVYRFPNYVLQWEAHIGKEGLDGGGGGGAEFIGEKGKLIVERSGIKWSPYGDHPGPEKKHEPANHIRDFLDNVKTRGKCRSDIETTYYTTVCCCLSNLTYLYGKSVKWDGAKGEIVGDRKAMECMFYKREYRKPWKLPIYNWA